MKSRNLYQIIFLTVISGLFFACSNGSSDSSDNSSTVTDNNNIVTDFPNGTTIWEGKLDYGNWESSFKLSDSYFNNFSAGDQIQITHTASESYSDSMYLIISPVDSDWGSNRLYEGTGINCAPTTEGLNPYSKNQTTAYTLSASDANKLNLKGLVIWGCGITVTKVVFSCKKAPKPNLFGFKYKTNYTLTMTDTNNNINLEKEPLYIDMGDNYDSNECLMGFRIKGDKAVNGSLQSWVGVSGVLTFSETEREGKLEIYERENNILLLQSADSASYTVPTDFSTGQEFNVSYTADFKTLTLENISSGTKYDFTITKDWIWFD